MRLLLLSVVCAGCTMVDASSNESLAFRAPTQTCEGAPTTDWKWRKLGVVHGLPEAERQGDGILAPALLESEGVLHLWYSEKTGSRYELFHSESRDGGESFAPPSEITGLGDGQMLAYPTVWREDG